MYKETKVYRLAFEQAMDVFELTRTFPKEELFALTNQIRRSTRSVCSNLAEAYRKKRYPQHFISKASDSDTENSETSVWFEFALACGYITQEKFEALNSRNETIGKLINHMLNNPEKY
jgi:four helix bundle protein